MPKALVIHHPDKYEAEEALALTEAAGYEVGGSLTQRFLSRSKYGVGEGKAEEAATLVREKNINIIIFDSTLNASQSYNLAKLCKVEVKDREKLILEIFAKRATTAEAKLQVQLAELGYELPRAREKVRRAKLGEQPGFFGLGKYQVDVYIRMIKRQMATLKKKAEEIRERRKIFRQRRERSGQQTVVLTGYTGAGKTTLFNRLTGEAKEVDRGVFTTLSLATRGINLGKKRVLVSDTVGFIDRLPTYMIDAFKSTLEEVSYADLALLLVDASTPTEKLLVNHESCVSTLAELAVPDTRILTVMNKTDLVGQEELGNKMWELGIKDASLVSAKTGLGIPELLREMEASLTDSGGRAKS